MANISPPTVDGNVNLSPEDAAAIAAYHAVPGDIVRCPVNHVLHGDCYPEFDAYYCYECDYFFKGAGHFLTETKTHDATHHLHRYLQAITDKRKPKRDTAPELNFFAVRIFGGVEPSPRVARVLAKLIWRRGAIDIGQLSDDARPAAVNINRYRAATGDDST